MSKLPVFASMGHLNIDIYLQVDKIPDPDSRESAKLVYTSVGGAATNYAITIARLGARVLLFACCGQDVLAEYALECLRKHGVDTKYIVRRSQSITGIVVCVIDSRGIKYMIAHEGANRLFSPPESSVIESEGIQHVHVVFSEPELVEKCLEVLSRCTVSVSLDMRTQVARRGLTYLEKLISQGSVKYVFMNYPELVELTGENDLDKGLSKLLNIIEHRCEVVITLGERGSIIAVENSIFRIPTIPVEVVDTTGAGDVYAAVYTLLRKLGADPETAGKVASIYSAVKCTSRGASSVPNPDEVARYLKSRGFIEAYAVFSKVLNECLNISV